MIMAGFPTQISVVATALNINLFRLFVTFSIVSKHYCTCIAVQHTHMAQHVTNDAAVDTALLYHVLSHQSCFAELTPIAFVVCLEWVTAYWVNSARHNRDSGNVCFEHLLSVSHCSLTSRLYNPPAVSVCMRYQLHNPPAESVCMRYQLQMWSNMHNMSNKLAYEYVAATAPRVYVRQLLRQ